MSNINSKKQYNHGFIKVASVSPPVRVADIDYNISKILEFAKKASSRGVKIIVFPELSITGYTAADLFQQSLLLKKAEQGLRIIKRIF